MKIAVCEEKGEVFQHFSHTPEFLVCDVKDGRIVSEAVVPCGESGHGALVDLLSKEKVEVLLCGGIGGGALSALAEAGIKVVGGAQGGAVRTVMAYLAGTLETEANFRCNHHHDEGHACSSGEHRCGGHCGR